MHKDKYYDAKRGRAISLESDGCELDEWGRLHETARFARHQKGFNIFLPPDRLVACDEYAEADPYTVEEHLDSEFQKRRRTCTIELLCEALSANCGVTDAPQILDLGCGQGHVTEMMRQAVNLAEFSGLDYSISAIEYAHEHFPQIDFCVGDAYGVPYASEFFDVVVCNNLWEHVPDPLFLLREIKRVLKTDGCLIMSTPSRYRVANLARVIIGKPVAFMSQHHITEYTVGQVIEQLMYGGFQVRRILSKRIPEGSAKATIAKWMLAAVLSLNGSHHQLESTVFFLAKKSGGAASEKLEKATERRG